MEKVVGIQRKLGVAVCLLMLCLLFGCGLTVSQTIPPEVTREVTRVVTATPTASRCVVTVTVVIVATPTSEEAIASGTASPTLPVEDTVRNPTQQAGTSTPLPAAHSPTGTSEAVTAIDALDDPQSGLDSLAKIASILQSQGIHTLRLTLDLSVPIEVVIRENGQTNQKLTQLVQNALSDYGIYGNYILDISLDDLARATWSIEGIGGTVGLETEQTAEWKQNGDRIWEKSSGGEWSLRTLTADEALLPLGNYLVSIDTNGHALNLSDLLVDALRPLLLTTDGDRLTPALGWKALPSTPVPDSDKVEIRRQRTLGSSENLEAVIASLASSKISQYVSPGSLSQGIERITCLEEARWAVDPPRVDYGDVRIQGEGTAELSYLMQRGSADAVVTISTDNSFEYLAAVTQVDEPGGE